MVVNVIRLKKVQRIRKIPQILANVNKDGISDRFEDSKYVA